MKKSDLIIDTAPVDQRSFNMGRRRGYIEGTEHSIKVLADAAAKLNKPPCISMDEKLVEERNTLRKENERLKDVVSDSHGCLTKVYTALPRTFVKRMIDRLEGVLGS